MTGSDLGRPTGVSTRAVLPHRLDDAASGFRRGPPAVAAVRRAGRGDDSGVGPASLPVARVDVVELHDLGYRQGMGFHYAVPQPARAIPLFLADAALLTPLS